MRLYGFCWLPTGIVYWPTDNTGGLFDLHIHFNTEQTTIKMIKIKIKNDIDKKASGLMSKFMSHWRASRLSFNWLKKLSSLHLESLLAVCTKAHLASNSIALALEYTFKSTIILFEANEKCRNKFNYTYTYKLSIKSPVEKKRNEKREKSFTIFQW